MIEALRKEYNARFTQEAYRAFLRDLDARHPGAIDFRVSETPVFIPASFRDRIIGTCERIIGMISDPGFRSITDRAIPPAMSRARETPHPHFICLDFGICRGESGQAIPKLIELQGFPSLYGFHAYYPEVLERHFPLPEGYSNYFSGLDMASYLELLGKVIIGDREKETTILLEIRPHEQKTRIDFYCTADYLGIPIVCITELRAEGDRLFYEREGRRIRIERIYNRVIFDDLDAQRNSLGEIPDLTHPWDVQWVTGLDWFYRLSKFTLPYIQDPHVPETWFLDEVKEPPGPLSDFVLKPLFSFAGQGVVIDITPEDLDAIKDPENWILQRKVAYADIIETPDIPAKAEIRMMYLWPEGAPKPILATNLARLSKGRMIGVRYNKDKEWVGSSVGYFER